MSRAKFEEEIQVVGDQAIEALESIAKYYGHDEIVLTLKARPVDFSSMEVTFSGNWRKDVN